MQQFQPSIINKERRMIWSKTLMQPIFNLSGEFRWSPECPVSQIHSPHLHAGAPDIFSDLLRSVHILKREWGAENNGKLPHLFIPSKTATSVPEFAMEDLPLDELQPWFVILQWKTCPWAKHSDDIVFECIYIYIYRVPFIRESPDIQYTDYMGAKGDCDFRISGKKKPWWNWY